MIQIKTSILSRTLGVNGMMELGAVVEVKLLLLLLFETETAAACRSKAALDRWNGLIRNKREYHQ